LYTKLYINGRNEGTMLLNLDPKPTILNETHYHLESIVSVFDLKWQPFSSLKDYIQTNIQKRRKSNEGMFEQALIKVKKFLEQYVIKTNDFFD